MARTGAGSAQRTGGACSCAWYAGGVPAELAQSKATEQELLRRLRDLQREREPDIANTAPRRAHPR